MMLIQCRYCGTTNEIHRPGCRFRPPDLDTLEQRVAALTTERDNLRAQLVAAQEWQPVEDGFVHRCRCADCREPNAWQWEIYVNGASIGIQDPRNDEDDRFVDLPPDLRLCRRTRQDPPA